METSDKPEMVRVLNGMAALYGKALSREQYEVYWLSMSDWPIDDFREAAAHLMKSCQFFPKPYDFEQLRKTFAPCPMEAWEKALRHAAGGGWRRSNLCGDDRVDRAIRAIGGFEALAMSDVSEHQWLSQKFMAAYGELSEVEDRREALPSMSERWRIGGPTSLKGVLNLLPEPTVDDAA